MSHRKIRKLLPIELVVVFRDFRLYNSQSNELNLFVALIVSHQYIVLPVLWDNSIIIFFLVVLCDDREYNSLGGSAFQLLLFLVAIAVLFLVVVRPACPSRVDFEQHLVETHHAVVVVVIIVIVIVLVESLRHLTLVA